MPQEMHRATQHDQFDVLENIGLFDCIECGCCCKTSLSKLMALAVGCCRICFTGG
jgi:Na+-translocating ferredoxin:NAD+ oxidoreductase RnfC subunit